MREGIDQQPGAAHTEFSMWLTGPAQKGPSTHSKSELGPVALENCNRHPINTCNSNFILVCGLSEFFDYVSIRTYTVQNAFPARRSSGGTSY